MVSSTNFASGVFLCDRTSHQIASCSAPYLTRYLAALQAEPALHLELRIQGDRARIIDFKDSAAEFFLTFALAMEDFRNGLTISIPAAQEIWFLQRGIPVIHEQHKTFPELERKISLKHEAEVKKLLGLLLSVPQEFAFALSAGSAMSYVGTPWKTEYLGFYDLVMSLEGSYSGDSEDTVRSALQLCQHVQEKRTSCEREIQTMVSEWHATAS